LSLLQLVSASVSTLSPVSIVVAPSAPAYVFQPVPGSSVSVSLGPNGTSASVAVNASNTAQLLTNPDFYSSPDYWYCSPGQSISCYWAPSDTGSSGGVVVLYGSASGLLVRDSAFIVQNVTVPDAPLASATLVVVSRDLSSSGLVIHLVEILDASTGQTVYTSIISPGSTYTATSLDVTNYLSPGKTYTIAVGVAVVGLGGFSVDYRVDSVYLYVQTSTYTFSGSVLAVNATSASSPRAVARLVLDTASSAIDQGLNATIYLVNESLAETKPITIVNGAALNTSTDTVLLSPPPPGYSSAHVRLEVSKQSATNSTLHLLLEICPSAGACSYYPLEIVIDPSGRGAAHREAGTVTTGSAVAAGHGDVLEMLRALPVPSLHHLVPIRVGRG